MLIAWKLCVFCFLVCLFVICCSFVIISMFNECLTRLGIIFKRQQSNNSNFQICDIDDKNEKETPFSFNDRFYLQNSFCINKSKE